jgi:hypothetical protein
MIDNRQLTMMMIVMIIIMMKRINRGELLANSDMKMEKRIDSNNSV